MGDATIEPAHPTNETFAAFDSPTFHRLYVQPRSDGLCSVDLSLASVTCAACVWLVERLPRVLPGVVEARLSLREATVRLTWNPQQIQLSRVAQSLDRLGYTPHPARSEIGREAHRREARKRLIHLGVAGAIMGNAMLLAFGLYAGSAGHMEEQYRMFFRWLSAALALVSLAWPGATFFRSAWAALRMRTTNLDVPIALALGVGGIAGLINVVLNRGEIYFDSLCVLIFLLLVGRFIQYRQQRWADDAVGLLFNLTPSTCRRVEGDQTIEIPAEAMAPGDVVEVRAGELFPADGIVLHGESTTSEALLTGESMPAPIRVGSAVHAGAQNVGSIVRVTVQSVGNATRIGKLMLLVEDGIREKPAIVQFADRVGKWFVVAITLIAAGTFAYWSRIGLPMAIDHTVALLIVTCPCVLGLATPLTIAIAIGRLARRDILVKNGVALEQLSRGGALLLDKTGTLTEGTLQLTAWFGDQSIRPLVAMAEAKSNHPVGRALASAAPMPVDIKRLPADERCWIDGPLTDIVERGDGGLSARCGKRVLHIGSPAYVDKNGVSDPSSLMKDVRLCQTAGSTAIVIAIDRRAVAVAALGDALRHDSASAVRQLAKLHFEPEILSGDAAAVVASAACSVGIDPAKAHGGMTPEQKLHRAQQRNDRPIVMVGDGVNDAAALAAADVGIAVHGGAEASLAAADVYIAQPGLQPIVELVQMSRRAMRIVKRNLVISLAYNILAGTLAVGGWMTPLIAAIIMPLSSASVLGLAVLSIGGFARPRQGAPR
jgi:Cu2+-exporting ATPase